MSTTPQSKPHTPPSNWKNPFGPVPTEPHARSRQSPLDSMRFQSNEQNPNRYSTPYDNDPRSGSTGSYVGPANPGGNIVGTGSGLLGLSTCLQSSTRWFQLVMFMAFGVALALGLSQTYESLSPGVIWGAVLSTFSVFFVILSYVSVPSYRQHPNPLVFWRTIADAFFVMQLLGQQFVRCLFYDCVPLCADTNWQCGCALQSTAGSTCSVFAGFFEFSLIASECWFFCMTINLVVSLNNPFTHFKRNTRYYHYFCWGMGTVMGLLLANTEDWAGYSNLGVCWTNALKNLAPDDPETCPANFYILSNFSSDYKAVNANIISWSFFYLWIAGFIIFGIAVWVWASRRLSEGMPQTYAVRVQSINRARFNVLAVTFYWIIVAIVYFRSLSRGIGKEGKANREMLNFLIAGKGYVDLVIWFALNDFQVSHFYQCLNDDPNRVEVDLSPQVNAALRQEVLFYTTSGIIQAVRASDHLALNQNIQHLALLPQIRSSTAGNGDTDLPTFQPTDDERRVFDENLRVGKNALRTKTFHDYEPHAFKKIRERFGVTNASYLQSLSATAKERLSEGASGAFMFFSADGALIVKSMSREECQFLRNIAPQYAEYLCTHTESLLTRFYGCHCLELYGKHFSFVVMANCFDTEQLIHSRYDIKGSWVNRHADLPKRGKKVTCRHCNRKYTYFSTATRDDIQCPVRLGGHEPNVVLKDADLTQKLKLEKDASLALYRQLQADAELLCSFGIMDYSLLIGVHEVEYTVDDTQNGDTGSPSPKHVRHVEQGRIKRGATAHMSVTSTSSSEDNAKRRNQVVRKSRRAESDASISSSGRRLPRDGMRLASTVVGPAFYHLGIIDILQTWTLQKRMERYLKIVLKRVDGNGLSAIAPKLYKERFLTKMADILDMELSDEDEGERAGLFTQQNLHMDVDTQPMNIQSIRSIQPAGLDSYIMHAGVLPSPSTSVERGSARMNGMSPHDDRRIFYPSHSERSDSIHRLQFIQAPGGTSDHHGVQAVGQDTEEYSGIDYHL
uniref:Phosphatidylinositol4phosphate5kinase (PIPKD1/GPCRPIPK) putative n=1 Tax=Albugo laibachii Nc14 TaxID=890382 RepID=F0WU87_9STRA|nr:phosphatidylinositol4phosphate5kinase (PIPKD1/GPCRPIPK) putative [Albugo laibachii Nc14]|eukprot:CCA24965.1 phosphatidylinositol4phosphate5kinase (PIPKD1/GPCRPIPK) putative [Albugo laibachii Nc14]